MKLKILSLIASIALICLFLIPMAEATYIPADDPHIQYFGRWNKTSDTYSCGYGATYIKANFYGTDISLKSYGDHSWWKYSIDNGEFTKFQIEDGTTVIASDLPEGPHSVFLVRCTEGEAGISYIKGFTLNKDGYMLEPSPTQKHKLEFVGDSITAGACNDGPQSYGWFDKEDNDMAWGPQLARMLDADYSVLAKSGEGVIHNYDEIPPYVPGKIHTADRYPLTYYPVNSKDNPTWNVENFTADAILVSIGTNDFSFHRPKPNKIEFINGYIDLIKTIRKYNPDSIIICIEPLPAMLDRDVNRWEKEAVNTVVNSGDDKLFYIPVNEDKPLLTPEDYVGDNTHPTKEGSRKLAEYLKDKVAKILGW